GGVAVRARMVRVVGHLRRPVERGREARLPVIEQVTEALVRLLGGAETRELPHRPEPAAIHRRVDAARVRVDAREAEVAVVVDVDVVGRAQRLDLEPRHRREELALPLGLRLVELLAPGLGPGQRLPILRPGHGDEFYVRAAPRPATTALSPIRAVSRAASRADEPVWSNPRTPC